jgi:hypothetical protein
VRVILARCTSVLLVLTIFVLFLLLIRVHVAAGVNLLGIVVDIQTLFAQAA